MTPFVKETTTPATAAAVGSVTTPVIVPPCPVAWEVAFGDELAAVETGFVAKRLGALIAKMTAVEENR